MCGQKSAHETESIIVIGNGIAGLAAAEAARKNNSHVPIIMVAHEKHLTYYRLRLCELLNSELDCEKLTLHPYEWYKERDIELMLGRKVISINPGENCVTLDDGRALYYGKLIITTGGCSYLPQLPGIDRKGVFTLWTMEDAWDIKEEMRDIRRAVVVGGGLLGLESAYRLVQKGIEVTIVEASRGLLSRQLDEKGGWLFEKRVRSMGINVLTGVSVVSIEGGDSVEEAVMSDGRREKADLVLFTIGTSPNTGIIANTGIRVNKGILVDSRMETSIPDIYAAGDAAEFEGRIPGQWAVAMSQGRVAGTNASGGNAQYRHEVSPYFLNAMDVKIYSIGDAGKRDVEYETMEYLNEDSYEYQKLFFAHGVLTGSILMGDVGALNRINQGIRNGISMEEAVRSKLIKE